MRVFDAHCHLQDKRLAKNRKKVIRNAIDAGVERIAVKATTEKDWVIVDELCSKYEFLHPSFGLHPWFLAKCSQTWLEKLKKYLTKYESAGIGEIGIDLHSKNTKVIPIQQQEEILIQQLYLAQKMARPVTIHCRNSWSRIIELLDEIGSLPGGFMIHCFGGSVEIARELLKRGAYLSFSGTITRPNNQKAPSVLKIVPTDRILLETDAPDLLPYGVNSVLNEPAFISYILNQAAAYRNESPTFLAEQSYINACRFFNIVNT